MKTVSAPGRTPEWLADAYVVSKQHSKRPVSTADAVRSLRAILRDSLLSDRELSDLIAKAAIDHGLNVSFDAGHDERGYLAPEPI